MAIVANAEMTKGLVILIADGKLYSRALLRSMLSQLGVRTICEAGEGAAAIEAIFAVNPDLAILDWDLPVVSAREVLRIVRTHDGSPNPDLPIIIISSSGQGAHVREAIGLGAQQFLVRPISLKGLERRLLAVVTKARKSEPAQEQDIQTPLQYQVLE
jgi:CheY-like chemotaxis protein